MIGLTILTVASLCAYKIEQYKRREAEDEAFNQRIRADRYKDVLDSMCP